MAEEVPEWQMMWGAKVKTPVDMRDDILKDAIEFTTKELLNADETLDQIVANGEVIQKIKQHMDELWEPNWHVVIGRNFGSKVTHEAKRFVYFYLQEKQSAVMIYKG